METDTLSASHTMQIDSAELRKGLRRTRTFLLAHHPPSEFHRCYSPVLFGRRVHVCARCLGIYPGIVAGLVWYFVAPHAPDGVLVVAVLPAPALVDWAVTSFRDRRGYNGIRTATGASLGCGYGVGVSTALFEFSPAVLVVGTIYGTIAGALIYYSWE